MKYLFLLLLPLTLAAGSVTVTPKAGNELNLLLTPEETVTLAFRNTGGEAGSVTGEAVVRDAYGKSRKVPVKITVPADGSVEFPLVSPPVLSGCYQVEYNLAAGDSPLAGSFRFARMNPAGPTKEPAAPFLFGMCSHPERGSRDDIRREALAAGLCGVKIVRSDFAWGVIQRKGPDDRNFGIYDYITDSFAAQGVEMAPIIDYEVAWAVAADAKPKNPNAKNNRLRPDYDKFAAYARLLAEHYRGKIRYFEIWNEPDLTGFANFPAEEYMELQRRAYQAIKEVNPETIVMNGGISSAHTNDSGVIRHNNGLFELLLADGGKSFDLFAYHGHGSLKLYIQGLETLKAKGLITPDKPWGWYSNETGLSSARTSELNQAGVLIQKMLTSMEYGAMGFNWYNLREKEKYQIGHHERHFGILTADFQPKPAYVSYNTAAAYFKGAKFLKRLETPAAVSALLFRHRDGDLLLAHWNSEKERLVSLGGVPEEITAIDLFGNEAKYNSSDLLWMRNGLTPAFLKFKGNPDSVLLGESPVKIPEYLTLSPSEPVKVPFILRNPNNQSGSYRIRIVPPAGLTVTPESAETNIASGETKELLFTFETGDEFRNTLTNPASVKVEFGIGGRSEELTIPVCAKPRKGAPLLVLDETALYVPLVASAPGNEHLYYNGKEDLSAEIYLSCRSYFHLRAVVTDDKHHQPEKGKQMYHGDSIQFAVKTPEQRGFWKIGLAHRNDGTSEAVIWNTPEGGDGERLLSRIQLVTSRDEAAKKTIYEVKIPSAMMGIDRRGTIRFSLMINDNDGELRKGFLAATPGIGTGDDESYFLELPVPELQ